MAVHHAEQAKILYEGYDISGDFNQAALTLGKDDLDDTVFGDSARSYRHGMERFEVACSGFANFGATETEGLTNTNWGSTTAKIITICPEDSDAGDIAYTGQGITLEYSFGGNVGEMVGFNFAAMSKGERTIRGTLLDSGAVTATGNSSGRELGAVTSSQYVYAVVHCTAVSGTDTPTLTIKVQSDEDNNWNTPTDRITFTDLTAVGAEAPTRVAGEITDTYWRLNYTVSGIDPSFTIYCHVGIF